MSTLEQLEVKTSKIKNDLQVLKAETFSYDEKRKKAETLKQQVDTIKIELQQKMGELNAQNDVNIQSEKEKAWQLLNSIEETTDLYNAILNNTATANQWTSENLWWNNNWEIATNDENNLPDPQKKEDEKWVIWKSWDWIKGQRNETTRENFKEKPGITLLRGVWFAATWVWAVALAYKWIKKLFWWGKDEEDENEEEATEKKSKKKKKKSFRKRPFWKFLKWTAIGVWWALGINRLWKYFGWWWKEWATWRDSDKNKYESYDEFVKKPENKEKFENYEWLWDKVDNVYQEIYGRELKSWYEDELEMKKISEEQSKWTKFYKGIVPYCLDNQFKNVEGILWQNSSFKTALYDGLDWMINFVKNAWGGFLKLFSECYLEYLPSWAPFKGMAWSLGDKIDQWKIKNQNAEKEMQYFFRQSIRVQTYLFQKKDQLTKKLVKEASQTYWISEDDIRNDQDKFDKYITKNSQYQNFLNNPTHSAVTVLEQNNIFDNHIDTDLKELVTEIDKDRNKILGCKEWEKDIIETINEKKQKSETLDASDDKKLWEACDGMLNSMEDIIEATEDSCLNIYEDLLRGGDSNLREYLEKSWLDKMFESYKQILLAKKQELLSGKLSNEDKIALSESINAMLALKKEAELWKVTIEKDYDENGNIIYRIPWFLVWSVKNLCKWVNKLIHGEWIEGPKYIASWVLWTWVTLMMIWWVWYFVNPKTWKAIAKVWWNVTKVSALPVYLAYKWANYFTPLRNFGHKINPLKYRWKNGAITLLKDLREWKISLERVWKIINRKCFWFIWWPEKVKTWKDVFWVWDDLRWTDMRKIAFNAMIEDKYYLRQLKDAPDNLYDDLIKQFDSSSEELRRALRNGESIDKIKSLKNSTSSTIENLSPARKAFNASVDRAISKLEKEAPNPKAFESHIKKLNALKKDWSLTDEAMEWFTKFIDKWFDAKLIPEIKKLFDVSDTLKTGEKIWDKLNKLLSEWDYDAFQRFLQTDEVASKLKKIGLKDIADNILQSIGKVMKTIWGIWSKAAKSVLKMFMYVISKFH